MNAGQYREKLLEQITSEEWSQLEGCDPALRINEHNRTTLLEMRENTAPDELKSIDIDAATTLEEELNSYLAEYLADAPEAHKWIVLASLYLAFVAQRPLHAIETAGVTTCEEDGMLHYSCPNKVVDSFICKCCVCELQAG